MSADDYRNDQQDEAVNGHTPGQELALIGRIFLRQQQEYRAASDWIHEWKQRADNQQDTFGHFEEHMGPEYTRIAGSPPPLTRRIRRPPANDLCCCDCLADMALRV